MERFKWTDMLLKATCSSIIFLLASCSSGTSSGSSSSAPVNLANTQAITIDAAGVIPIIGGRATSTYVYVHNNTDKTISGITYSTSTSNINPSSSFSFKKLLALFGLASHEKVAISASSTSICSSIPANGSCMLSFTTPIPDSKAFQGSSTVTASYTYAGKNNNYSQILSYQTVDSTTINGVVVNSGVSIVANQNNTSYGMIYLYASGAGQNYTVDSMELNKPAFSITQGNVTGTEMTPGWIQAVEIAVPNVAAGSGSFNVNLTVLSSVNSNKYTSLGTIGIQSTAVNSGAILVAGLPPVLNTNVNPNGTIQIYNAGNQPANNISISPIAGTEALSNTCGSTLNPYQSCTYSFKVTSTSAYGNVIQNIGYSGGTSSSLSTTISWYSNNSPLAGQYAPAINFNATESQNVLVTMVNYGTTPFTNITIPVPTVSSGGGASVSLLTESNTCIESLAVGDSCSYYIHITKNSAESGYYILARFQASYVGGVESYTRVLAIPYTVNSYHPVITIIPDPKILLSIIGNNIESQQQTLTISNIGAAPGIITANALSGTIYPFISTSGSCTGSLNAGESCANVIVKLGPKSAESLIQANLESYSVTYTGGDLVSPQTISRAINATIQPESQNISLTSVNAVGTSSGNGQTASTPWTFDGSNAGTKTITLTYTNTGDQPITIRGVANTNDGFQYAIESTSTTCVESAIVAVGGTCTVVFSDVLANNFLGLGSFGSILSMPLSVPTLIFTSNIGNNQFVVTPTLPSSFTGGNIIYARSQQATLTLSSSQLSGPNGNVTESSVLANATGYTSNINVVTNMEDYFKGVVSSTGGCTNTSESGIRKQTCNLSSSNLFGGVVYTVESAYTGQTLSSLSTVTVPSGQVISVNGIYNTLILH